VIRGVSPSSQPSPIQGDWEGLPRPWYYQAWFLYPSFLFWPVWSVLIIRSPWQNSSLAGSIAWAVLFSGIVLSVVRLTQGGTVAYSTLALMAPGLLLTVITQAHWTAYRRAWRPGKEGPPPGESDGAGAPARSSRGGRVRRSRSRWQAGVSARRRR
jgi:hypothetical protein